MAALVNHGLAAVPGLLAPSLRVGVAPTLGALRDAVVALAARRLEERHRYWGADPAAAAVHEAAAAVHEAAAGLALHDGFSGDHVGVLCRVSGDGTDVEFTWQDLALASQTTHMGVDLASALRVSHGGRTAIAPPPRFALGPAPFAASARFVAADLAVAPLRAAELLAREMIARQQMRGATVSPAPGRPTALVVDVGPGGSRRWGFEVDLDADAGRRVLSSR